MQTIDRKEETELLEAVNKVASIVQDGETPDSAVEKVARDYGFGPGKIRLIGQAFNTGRQLQQWRTPNTNILTKLANFTLCDPQRVITAIYGTPEKQASIAPEYTAPPSWLDATPREKAAAFKLPTVEKAPIVPEDPLRRELGNIQRLKFAADESRRLAVDARSKLAAKTLELVAYYKYASAEHVPFAELESVVRTYVRNPMANELLNVVHAQAGGTEKRASAALPLHKPVDHTAKPFSLFNEILDIGATYGALTKAAEEQQKQWQDAYDRVHVKKAFGFGTEVAAIAAGDILAHKATHPEQEEDPYGDIADLDESIQTIRQQAARPRQQLKIGEEKVAFFTAGLGAAIGSSIARNAGQIPKPKDEMVQDAWMGLEDPDHENNLRRIRAHALLNQMMTDSDDPISSHEPDKVLAAFNEISSATPRLAENAALLRPVLRKRLEGHQEPFEAKELLDIEQGIAKSKMPTPMTHSLGGAPDKMLG